VTHKKIEELKDLKWVILTLILVFTAGSAWTTDRISLEDRISTNTDYRLVQTYDKLLRRVKAQGKLSIRDQRAFCNAARRLGIGGEIVKKLCG
jgi:hypothetical protein|tara:strand:+ start:4783 stop:5061 length:279 start_codon:yes stop_codon:yes gene_type:complete